MTVPLVAAIERIDDIPLLLAQMEKLKLAKLLDEEFPMHGNWDGLFQFGHSKDHRPDLPQLKINQSALDPLGIPLTTTIVSGEKADDPLYIPEISKVQKIINAAGVLFIGDCKMASFETRAYVASSGD